MSFLLSALQFGKELLEVKGETEKKEFWATVLNGLRRSRTA